MISYTQRSLHGDYMFITKSLLEVKCLQDPNNEYTDVVKCGKCKRRGWGNKFFLYFFTFRLYMAITIADTIKNLLITRFIP